MSFKRALLILVILVLAVGTIPAGIVAYARLARALEENVRESLAMAPDLLNSRWAATVDVRMMHARDLARTTGLAEALDAGDDSVAGQIAELAGSSFRETPVLVGRGGTTILPSDTLPAELVEATQRGEMPVAAVPGRGSVYVLSLAPVEVAGKWVGAAGGVSRLDEAEAATLAALTRSAVLILDAEDEVVGSAGAEEGVDALAPAVPSQAGIHELHRGDTRFLAVSAPLSSGSRVVFVKDLDQELSVLPLLRRIALWSAGITLVLAVLMGGLFAGRLARPVHSLASAAGRLAAGDFDAPLQRSGLEEIAQVSDAFDQMRSSLRSRLAELEEANRRLEAANRELEEGQQRLMVLQTELVQRDRLASAGRLLAQLAHEIRNPIASIRNCLEVLRRRTSDDPDARQFADMAIDELLRMHELTEQMLDVHRPRDPESSACDVTRVAHEVASLLKAGTAPGRELNVSVVSPGGTIARIAPDSLKQVLLNLGLNAREAMQDEGPIEIVVAEDEERVRIEVVDRGPGVRPDVLPRIFDPFFTTKSQVQGVGLGLFTAEAIVRTYGGRIQASNREDGPGARFTMELTKG